jgi:6-phosphogluconolactonase (cycloisomerase 2 family)
MKSAKWAWVLLLASMPLLNGCAGFWDASSSDTTTTTTLSSGVFYVLNIGTNQIVAYYVSSGTLTKLAAYSTPAGATPITLTVAHSNNYLYLSTASGIYLYTISSSGALTLDSSGVISTDNAYSMQVDSSGQWLVESISGNAGVYAIPLNTSTGKPPTSAIEQSLALPGSSIKQLTISPDNSHVFVAMGTAGTEVIPFNSANTNPFSTGTQINVMGSGGGALSVAVDPTNRLFYIGETAATSGSDSGGLRVFKFSSLPSVAEISGSPFASGGLAPYSILPISTGSYVYVANRQTNSGSTGLIKGFTVTSSSSAYSLTALSSTYSPGTNTVALAEDSTDQFIFAVSSGGSYDLSGYIFDTSTAGTLDTVIQSATGTDPVQAGAIAAAH